MVPLMKVDSALVAPSDVFVTKKADTKNDIRIISNGEYCLIIEYLFLNTWFNIKSKPVNVNNPPNPKYPLDIKYAPAILPVKKIRMNAFSILFKNKNWIVRIKPKNKSIGTALKNRSPIKIIDNV